MKFFLLFLLIGTSTSIHITCNFYIGGWVVIGSVYTCDVKAMDFSDNSTHITGYDGNHLAGKSSGDVEFIFFPFIDCPSFNLTTVPKGVLNIFPNFIAFQFLGCPVNFLNGDELDDYPNLKFLALSHSNLTRVPGNFFSSTPNLRFTYLGSNQIEHVGFGLLDDLNHLVEAWFDRNICIDQRASNPSQVPALIEALRQNCPDIEPEPTTSTSTTTNQPPKCEIDNLEDFVCELEEEIDVLRSENQNLKRKVENLEESNESLQTRTEGLEVSNESLKVDVANLKAENEEIRAVLIELERIILDLTSRPCTC